MATKHPNYYEMSYEELGEHLDRHHQTILENRAWLREHRGKENLDEEIEREEAIAKARGHFNVISRLRTAHSIAREFENSKQIAVLRGRITQETYERMLQDIGVPFIKGKPIVSSGSVSRAEGIKA